MARNILLTLAAAATLSTLPLRSATPTIGVESGKTDLADGAELRTSDSPDDVRLQSGVSLRLDVRSAGTVFGDHAILREGAVRIGNFENYPVQARQLKVEADTEQAQAVIRINAKTIEVASLGGGVKVTDGGAMLTRVAAGTKMAFKNSGQNSGASPGQSGAAPAQTGAAPAEKGPMSDKKAILWAAGICAVGAIVVGSIAAAQGKSPF